MGRFLRARYVIALVSAALIAFGAGTLVSAGSSDSQVTEFGIGPSASGDGLDALTAASTPAPVASDAMSSATASPTPQTGTSFEASAVPELPEPAPPTRIRIPAQGISADVIPVGLDRAQAVKVPDDISEVGWYRYSMAPNQASGATVLVGHRDGRVDGRGVFYNLGLLSQGDRVVLQDQTGTAYAYRVTSRRVLAKSAFEDKAERIFADSGAPVLRLISCGGYYDPDHGGYQANVIVTAVPDPGDSSIS